MCVCVCEFALSLTNSMGKHTYTHTHTHTSICPIVSLLCFSSAFITISAYLLSISRRTHTHTLTRTHTHTHICMRDLAFRTETRRRGKRCVGVVTGAAGAANAIRNTIAANNPRRRLPLLLLLLPSTSTRNSRFNRILFAAVRQ